MMVDDEEVCVASVAAVLGDEAVVVAFAARAMTLLTRGADLGPDGVCVGDVGDGAAVSGGGGLCPSQDRFPELSVADAGEGDGVALDLKTVKAEVVAAALEVDGGERDGRVVAHEDAREQRDVFVEDLRLERFCGCGDDHTFLAEDGGDEVSEGFAGASSGFDDGALVVLKGLMDGQSHLELLRSGFVALQKLVQQAART